MKRYTTFINLKLWTLNSSGYKIFLQ